MCVNFSQKFTFMDFYFFFLGMKQIYVDMLYRQTEISSDGGFI